jgi:hypothetical protein
MGSLEEARRLIETLIEERDFFKKFWQHMTEYQTIMNRFQVPPPSHATAPFGAPSPGSSSAPVSQVNAPQLVVSANSLYSATANLTASELHQNQSQQEKQLHRQPPQQSNISTSIILQTQIPLRSTPETASNVTQLPETLSKRESIKSIESYFVSMNPISRPANTSSALTSDEPVQHSPNYGRLSGTSPLKTQCQSNVSTEITETSTSPDLSSVPSTEKDSVEPGGHKDKIAPLCL